jgi:hypothetical protein
MKHRSVLFADGRARVLAEEASAPQQLGRVHRSASSNTRVRLAKTFVWLIATREYESYTVRHNESESDEHGQNL